tara:strand:+ start:526 stop:1536 length:1011 start_codon:yes stop_codon:yes gene_type:complete
MSNAKFKPSKGSWGMFGASKGSRIGTIRRAQKADIFSDAMTTEGDVVTGLSGMSTVKTEGKFKTNFLEDWKEKQYEEPFERKLTEFETDSGLEGTGLESTPLPEGLGEELGAITAAQKASEFQYETSLGEAQDMEREGVRQQRTAEQMYEENINKLSRAQGQTLSQGVKQESSASAAGSQSGFAYSGPVERVKSMGQDAVRTSLSDIESQKMQATALRDKAIREGKAQVSEAKTMREGAEKDFASAQADYDAALMGTGGLKQQGLNLVEDMNTSVLDIVTRDRELHSSALAQGGASKLWGSPTQTNDFDNLMSMIDTARKALEGWDGSTDIEMGEE